MRSHSSSRKLTFKGTRVSAVSSNPLNQWFRTAALSLFLIFVAGTAFSGWESQNSPVAGIEFHCVKFIDTQNGWIVGKGGVILKTTDGGQHWVPPLSSPTSTDLFGVDFIDANVGWIVGEGGEIWKTANGGQSWTSQTFSMTQGYTYHLTSVLVLSSMEAWITGLWYR